MSKERITLYGLVSIIAILYFVYMTLQISLSTKGIELRQIQQETLTLQQINMDLENHYLEAAAYTTIDREARAQGFVPAPTIIIK